MISFSSIYDQLSIEAILILGFVAAILLFFVGFVCFPFDCDANNSKNSDNEGDCL